METNCNKVFGKLECENIFSKKSFKLKSFYVHAVIYVIGLIVFVLKEYYEFPLNFFPFQFLNAVVMVIWSSVFLVTIIDLFASYKIYGEEWENRKLKSILDKKQKREQKQKWE